MSTASRIQRIFEEIEVCPMQLDEYNDSIVRQLIEKITVNSEQNSLEIQFIGGLTITENLE